MPISMSGVDFIRIACNATDAAVWNWFSLVATSRFRGINDGGGKSPQLGIGCMGVAQGLDK
jgi:hypothetical protein